MIIKIKRKVCVLKTIKTILIINKYIKVVKPKKMWLLNRLYSYIVHWQLGQVLAHKSHLHKYWWLVSLNMYISIHYIIYIQKWVTVDTIKRSIFHIHNLQCVVDTVGFIRAEQYEKDPLFFLLFCLVYSWKHKESLGPISERPLLF